MRTARELELKFTVGPDFQIPPLDEQGVGVDKVVEMSSQQLAATYYDTEDLRLAHAGLTLRYRINGEAAGVWTLKLPETNGSGARQELTFAGDGQAVPQEASDLITGVARGRPVKPAAQLNTQRQRWHLLNAEGSELAELVDDRVTIMDGDEIRDWFREVEIEAATIDDDHLKKIGRALRKAGAGEVQSLPKAFRAFGPLEDPPPAAPQRDGPASGLISAMLDAAVRRMILFDPHVRLGEMEAVHQMRVAIRRLRSNLRTFAPLMEASWVEPLRGELDWIAGLLGAVRDLDVLASGLKRTAADLDGAISPAFAELDRRSQEARGVLRQALTSSRYVALLDRLLEDAREPRCTPEAARDCQSVIPPLVSESWKELAKVGSDLTAGSPEKDFHAARIQAKRTRYAAEAASGCLGRQGAKAATTFARRLERIQNVLGELQDTAVARQFLTEMAGQNTMNGALNLALGRLVEREEVAAANCKRRFAKVWKSAEDKRLRRWLNGSAAK
jgi:CHAD domain-containing protein